MLKRETRIMGLSGIRTGGNIVVTGVIFRGSLWLDGLVTSRFALTQSNYCNEISRMIAGARQFSQLHAIIVSRRLTLNRIFSIGELSRRTRIPVISLHKPAKKVSLNNRAPGSKNFTITVNRKSFVVCAAGVARKDAELLYRIGCSEDNWVPEPVRVADMLAKQLQILQVSRQGELRAMQIRIRNTNKRIKGHRKVMCSGACESTVPPHISRRNFSTRP